MTNEMETLEREQRADLALNPFAKSAPNAVVNAAAEAATSRAIAEVQAAMIIAQRFPRNEVEAMDKILNAFSRTSLAEVAQYEYAKGGTDIRGPSIRAMEAIAQLWGHIHSGVEELDQRAGMSTLRSFAFDAQTGAADSKTFQVQHIRHTRSGSYRLEDPREIYELGANMAARRKRACLQAVIPGDVIEAAMHQADLTLHTKAEITPERLAALSEKFAELGVTKEAIEARIQRRLDTMSPAQMVKLGKIYNSIKDGMSAAGDWFDLAPAAPPDEPAAPTRGAAGLKAAVAAKRRGRPPAAAVTPPPLVASFAQVHDALMAAVEAPAKNWLSAVEMIQLIPDEGQQTELFAIADRLAHERADRALKADE